MIGYLVWKNGGWRIRYYEEEINGVHILRAEVPGTPHTARGGRLQRKAMEVLRRNGVSRFLNPELVGARKVATGPLWRAMAAPPWQRRYGRFPWTFRIVNPWPGRCSGALVSRCWNKEAI